MPSTLELPDRTRRPKRDHDDMLSGGSEDMSKPSETSNDDGNTASSSDQDRAEDGLNVLVRRRLIKSVQRQPRYRFQIAAANYEAEDLHDENDAWYRDEMDEIEANLEMLRNEIRSIKRRRTDVNTRYAQQRELIYHENSEVQSVIDKGDRKSKQDFVQQTFHPRLALAGEDNLGGTETVYELGGLGTMGVTEHYKCPEHSHFVRPTPDSLITPQTALSVVFSRHRAIMTAYPSTPNASTEDTKPLPVSPATLHSTLPFRSVAGKTTEEKRT